MEYKIEIRDRLKRFARKILQLSEMLPKSERGRIINNQLTRSGTSTCSNYRAAFRGRSKADFFSKLSIVVEQADETEMWLDLIIDSGVLNSTFINALHAENVELLKTQASMRKKISS